jgi:hypothetical protein
MIYQQIDNQYIKCAKLQKAEIFRKLLPFMLAGSGESQRERKALK